MNFLLAWIALSVVCTGFVMLCIRLAPVIEDPPLDRFDGMAKELAYELELDETDAAEDESDAATVQEATADSEPVAKRAATIPIMRMKRVPHLKRRARSMPRQPKLAHYLIIRSEETQS